MAKAETNTRPGRPAFKPSAKQKRTVAIAAGAGTPHESIAAALGISRSTLIRHFRAELTTGACAKRMEVLGALYAAAKRGSASAAKCYLALGEAPAVPRVPAKGKKEIADIEANEPITDPGWAGILQ